jgi:D-methionine transport system ATP-binding protein
MISIEGLTKAYDSHIILKDITIQIEKGDIYGLVGSSGVGKSTLLRCINGLENIQEGDISVDGVSVHSLSEKDLRRFRMQIGMIFQNFSLLERKTVYENIALPMECCKYGKREIKEKVDELLKLVNIDEKRDCRPNELSGGQKQRVAIARALTLNPKVLLCDEATSALDPKATKSIIHLLKDINRRLEITIIVVTHEMTVVRELCKHMAIIENGMIKAEGSVEDVFLNRPKEFQTLVGEELPIIPETGIMLKVILPRQDINKPIFTAMARALDVDFTFLSGQIDTYQDQQMGQLFIHIEKKDKGRIIEYLQRKQIRFEEIERKDEV